MTLDEDDAAAEREHDEAVAGLLRLAAAGCGLGDLARLFEITPVDVIAVLYEHRDVFAPEYLN